MVQYMDKTIDYTVNVHFVMMHTHSDKPTPFKSVMIEWKIIPSFVKISILCSKTIINAIVPHVTKYGLLKIVLYIN